MEIKVVNVKCNGCWKTVEKELKNIWIKNIEVCFTDNDSTKERTIKFEWDYEVVKEKLTLLGYPEVGSEEAESILKKMKSFVSCATGKMSK
jgi:copper chaperone CopZ